MERRRNRLFLYLVQDERLAVAVGHAAEIAGITYESEVADAGLLGPYALSALAFRNAQLERGKVSDRKIVEYFLAEAI